MPTPASCPNHHTRLRRALATTALLGCMAGSAQADAGTATATAALGQIRVSYETLDSSVTQYPWIWIVTNQTWVPISSKAEASLTDPALSQQQTGWLTEALQAGVNQGGASASAVLGTGDLANSAGSASAAVTAVGGQFGTALAQLFNGQILLSPKSRLTVSATVSSLAASGGDGSAQALATLQVSNLDGSGMSSSEAWIFDSPSFADSQLAPTLSVQWTNNSSVDATYAKVFIGTSAQAESVTAVPEASTGAMLALGLLVLGLAAGGRQGQAR